MNPIPEPEIERLLQSPPRPKPPGGLKQRLIARAEASRPASPSVLEQARAGWFRRWWPTLAPAGLAFACAVVLASQQVEMRQLKEQIRALSAAVASETTPATHAPATREDTGSIADQQEIARLKDLVAQLTAEVSQLEKARSDNRNVRTPSTGSEQFFSKEELDAVATARERAMKAQCINHLKQVALAAHLWANTHNDAFPVDILEAKNEMMTPKILHCASDKERSAATNWDSFRPNENMSFSWYAPLKNDRANRVMLECNVHGSVALVDGSVQADVRKAHPEWIINRDGKLYFERPAGFE